MPYVRNTRNWHVIKVSFGRSTSLVDAIPKYGLSRLRFRRIMTVFLHTV